MKFSKLSNIYEVCSNNSFYYILRNNLTNNSFFLDEKEFEKIKVDVKKNRDSENIDNLKKSHIVVPNNYSEDKFIKFIKKKYSLDVPEINIFYLTFNNDCNLACKYCYVEGSYDKNKKSLIMENNTFLDTLEFINNFIKKSKRSDKISKKISFIYYGSEPLLTPKYVKESIIEIDNLCKNIGVEREIHIITNATLITPDLVDYFKKYNVELAISLDGPKKINDDMRIFKSNNKGTFEKIIKSIKLLNKSKINFGISCTIGPHNVEILKENIEYFKTLKAGGVGFNTLLDAKNKNIPFLSTNRSNDSLIEASNFANKNGLYEDRVQRKVKAFNRKGHPHFKDCGAVGNQLVFYPNGDIGVCQAYLGCQKPIVGNVNKDKRNPLRILESDVMERWTKRQPINFEECQYCPAIGICGGGCLFNAEIKQGDISKREKFFCVHTHKILDWLLIKSMKEKLKTDDIYIKNISFMFT